MTKEKLQSTPEEDFTPIKDEELPVVEKRKAGRPKGATKKSVQVGVSAPRCPSCGSSDRRSPSEIRSGTVRQKIEGLFEGKPYNEILVRRRQCVCGQWLIEKTYELSKIRSAY